MRYCTFGFQKKYQELLASWGPDIFLGRSLIRGVCVWTYVGSFRFPLLLPVCLHQISNPQLALPTVMSYVNLQLAVPQNLRLTNSLHIYNARRRSDVASSSSIALVCPSLQWQVKLLHAVTAQLFVEVTRTIRLEREMGSGWRRPYLEVRWSCRRKANIEPSCYAE